MNGLVVVSMNDELKKIKRAAARQSDSFSLPKMLWFGFAIVWAPPHNIPFAFSKSLQPHTQSAYVLFTCNQTAVMNMEIFIVCTQGKSEREGEKKIKPALQQQRQRSMFIDTSAQARFNEPIRKGSMKLLYTHESSNYWAFKFFFFFPKMNGVWMMFSVFVSSLLASNAGKGNNSA